MTVFLVSFVLISIFILASKAYHNTKQVVLNHVTIDNVDKEIEINSAERINILQISDMHLENISFSSEQLLEKLKGEQIDLIALTGDFLDRKRSISRLIPYLEAFQEIDPKYGTFAVFGNHDYVLRNKNFLLLKEALEAYDCRTMQNEVHSLVINGKAVNIIGIDDYSTNRSNLDLSYRTIEDGYNLVLTHDPNIVLDMEDFHFDYLLSGHFHGGQIHWPKPYHLVKMGKLVRMNMVKGLHSHHGKPFYISEGLGQTGVNIRVGSRPEMTIHTIDVATKSVQDQKTISA
jgi:predicted MPP superfamily phosphohydrolase